MSPYMTAYTMYLFPSKLWPLTTRSEGSQLAEHAFTILFKMSAEFYLRYYVGHKGKFGHEFLEFEFRPDGKDMIQQLVRL